LELGAFTIFLWMLKAREWLFGHLEEVTGARLTHSYVRVGGVIADLPAGWKDDVLELCELLPGRFDEYDEMLTGQPIFQERTQGVGVLTAEQAIALGVTGPVLRAAGVAWDLRKDQPYLYYDQLDFDVVAGQYGDAFDRYAVRLAEMRESVKIVRQIVDLMPAGDYRVQDKKLTPPPRARIDESMEALIHHFKLFTEGFRVPPGETYVAVEAPRGELGCYLVSDGGPKPYRMHIRGPSFANLQSLPVMLKGGLVADAVAVISSLDPVMGDVDR
jgi:NADH-quinone oxidoreductase subunit D